MNAILSPVPTRRKDEAATLRVPGFHAYAAISDALEERPGARLLYCDGGLTFLVTSRLHDWYAERLANLSVLIADGCDVLWEDAGRATLRREEMDAGLEGDGAFYFGEHAEIMKGGVNVDLAIQPPPDLAFEVEVSRSAEKQMVIYGRLGVPEVWRLDVEAWSLGFWHRNEDGTYSESPRSRFLATIEASEIVALLRLSEALGSARWYRHARDWVRDVLAPRQARGA